MTNRVKADLAKTTNRFTDEGFEARVVEAFGGIAIKDVADIVSVPYSTLKNYLQQRREIPLPLLREIANLTKTSVHWLLTGEGSKQLNGGGISHFNAASEAEVLWLRRTLGEKIADIIIKESAQDSYWNQPSEYLKELVEESLKTRGLWPEEKSALMELFDVTFRHVRVWGEIAAGKPIEFYEREEYVVIALPPDLVGKDLHALKVNGDSMDEEVKDGEIVVCEKTSKATDGDLVVVFVEDEGGSTLKRIYRDNGHVRLEPRNKKHKPKIYDAHKVTIQGVVRLIQRRP